MIKSVNSVVKGNMEMYNIEMILVFKHFAFLFGLVLLIKNR